MWQKQLSNLKTKSVRKPRSVRKKSKSVGRGRSDRMLCSFKRGGSKSRLNMKNYCIENNIKKTGGTATITRGKTISEGGKTIEKLQQLQQEKGELKRTHAAQQDNVATPWEKKIQ